MSTKWKVKPYLTTGGVQTGLEGIDIPEDFEMPSCGIEDVDRALFKLFNEDLPLYFTREGTMKRIPCVFAGGERAVILRRKEPLRDRQGAIILPLVSILRSGLDQSTESKAIGTGTGSLTLRKKIAPEDRVYKKLVNANGLQNQDGTVAVSKNSDTSLGLTNTNVFEIITMPNPKFFKATYEITFWAQYLQEMNNIIEAFITSYNNQVARSFKIETDKGYWFVATVESGLSNSNNFDGYLDEERVIRTSVNIEVTGYVINPSFPGAPKPFRRYVSAPKVQFETKVEKPVYIASSKVPSGDPEDYVYDDFLTERQPLPGKGVASVSHGEQEFSVNIGGEIRDSTQESLKTIKNNPVNIKKSTSVELIDPFTDKASKATIKSKNLSKGETVYILIDTLD